MVTIISTGLEAVLGQYELFTYRNARDHLTWTIGNKESHTRGVYHTQYTSRMETARVEQEEEADTRIIVKEQ